MSRRTDPAGYASPMLAGIGGDARRHGITLVTDAFVVRGTIETRHRRITDMLNSAEHDFLVLADATFDEFGSTGAAIQADYAQVNLGAVLFGVADEPVEATPELRVPKVSERALISVPPFTVTGHIHLMPERDLHEALEELMGRFVPVTEATYWSDRVGEARNDRARRRHQPQPGPDPGAASARSIRGPASIAVPARARGPSPASAPASSPRHVGSGLAGGRPPRLSVAAHPWRDQRSTGRSSRLPHSAQPPS